MNDNITPAVNDDHKDIVVSVVASSFIGAAVGASIYVDSIPAAVAMDLIVTGASLCMFYPLYLVTKCSMPYFLLATSILGEIGAAGAVLGVMGSSGSHAGAVSTFAGASLGVFTTAGVHAYRLRDSINLFSCFSPTSSAESNHNIPDDPESGDFESDDLESNLPTHTGGWFLR